MKNAVRINKSAARVVDVLQVLAQSDKALTQLEISQRLDIPKSSTYELLYTLLDKGILEFENENLKTFHLGIKLFEYGMRVLGKTNVHQVARPVLETLSEETGEIVFMAVENEGEIVYLDRIEKNITITRAANVGNRFSMHCTGLGKALLATYPETKVKAIWNKTNHHEVYTKNTILDYKSLINDLKKIRQRGYAIDNGEREEIIYCVAAPIYDFNDAVVCAISISTLYPTVTPQKKALYSQKIVETALTISKLLGFRGNTLYSTDN